LIRARTLAAFRLLRLKIDLVLAPIASLGTFDRHSVDRHDRTSRLVAARLVDLVKAALGVRSCLLELQA
jgi:hypothetical protein